MKGLFRKSIDIKILLMNDSVPKGRVKVFGEFGRSRVWSEYGLHRGAIWRLEGGRS